ncbi:C-type lectin domain family 4 member M-like isoform X2 [Cololabis saira]|uniref:C-type lectin domain family 4 member M-like isoform X2 n=1 Tax=Cololabis saira TaxID=129043 RepID=UPI002AD55C6E|nr:C-type lectin domain family 4 member M-like isoform X2 [Cololabis saira]
MAKSQLETDEDMSFDKNIYQENFLSHRQTSERGRSGSAFPHQRLVTLGLSLLCAALLVVAAVLGIYCAKAKDFQLPPSADAALIAELNHFRNHSGIIRAKLNAESALMRERTNHLQMKLQIKQKKTVVDILQGKIEKLQIEKSSLHTNKTVLEKNCGRCPSRWILLKSSCYYFSNQNSEPKKNWSDSRADCIHRGGDLLVINSLEKQQLISDNFRRASSGSEWWLNGFWIGLTQTATQGTWVWINNVVETSSIYWRLGQPSESGPQSGSCAAFLYYSDAMRTWYNSNCNEHHLNWICEMNTTNVHL